MINIKELQIGDWVSYNGIPNQIALADFGTDEGHASWRDKLEPIPLTPEILEKNGFDSNDNAFGHQDYNLFDDFFLENRGDRFCISRKLSKYGSPSYFVMEILYVHQLQNFFRLCRIYKEIVL